MRTVPLALAVGMLSLSVPAFARDTSSAQKAASAKPDADVSFDALKALAGTWAGTVTTNPPNPELDGPIQVTMRVASGGNALVHEIAPGGVPEPTVIYVEDGRLTLVHYCEAGNRPKLVARTSVDPTTVRFDFVSISGSKKPAYVRDFVFRMTDTDHHLEDLSFALPGDKQVLHAHFDLRRVKQSVSPPPASK